MSSYKVFPREYIEELTFDQIKKATTKIEIKEEVDKQIDAFADEQ